MVAASRPKESAVPSFGNDRLIEKGLTRLSITKGEAPKYTSSSRCKSLEIYPSPSYVFKKRA